MRKLFFAMLALGMSACAPGVYRLSDSGIRCVREPCPSILAAPPGVSAGVRVSGIEYPASMTEAERQRVAQRVFSPEGLLCEGAVVGQGDGRVFVLDNVLEP